MLCVTILTTFSEWESSANHQMNLQVGILRQPAFLRQLRKMHGASYLNVEIRLGTLRFGLRTISSQVEKRRSRCLLIPLFFAGVDNRLFGAGVFQLVAWKENKRWIVPFEFEIKVNREGRMLCKTDGRGRSSWQFQMILTRQVVSSGRMPR